MWEELLIFKTCISTCTLAQQTRLRPSLWKVQTCKGALGCLLQHCLCGRKNLEPQPQKNE